MLSRLWIGSERLAVLRGRERFIRLASNGDKLSSRRPRLSREFCNLGYCDDCGEKFGTRDK
jgi:hypothetical protein